MNIKIICAGHALQEHERAWMDEYEKRSGRFARLEVARIKEKSRSSPEATALTTWQDMKEAIPSTSFTLLLDPKGKLISTEDLKKLFLKAEQNYKGNITFVIGGSYGLPEEAKKSSHQTISLTPLTLPHRIALLVLIEQIYRVLTIRSNTPYHH